MKNLKLTSDEAQLLLDALNDHQRDSQDGFRRLTTTNPVGMTAREVDAWQGAQRELDGRIHALAALIRKVGAL